MLRKLILVGLIAFAGLAFAGEAGRIVFSVGQAHLAERPAALGDAVQEGNVIVTGTDGYVYIKTIDSGFLILRPNTKARITAYHVDQQNPANTRIKLELLSGVARSISGLAVKQARQNFRFNTPVAAIGVRGTDFTVFTDQQTSRVTVISGGVVVSGFEGACTPEGTGPCEGGASRELFAGQTNQLLQIQKGQAAPKLMHGNVPAPDVLAPPRNDEPVSKAITPGMAPLTANEVSLDPQKTKTLLAVENLPAAVTPPPVVVVPPVVVAPPPVVVAPPPLAIEKPPEVVVLPPPVVPPVVELQRSPPEILWGRWESVAGLAADSEALAKLKNGSYDPGRIVGSFVIARLSKSELVLPQEGKASFGLVRSEAYISAAGKAPVAATIQDSSLNVDFASRGFTTNLTVVAPGAQVDIQAQGSVTYKGELVGDPARSNASIIGYLGDVAAREAGYVFKSTDTPTLSAFGATKWSR
ncbi:MAG: FecR family protein [Proteobacteria bacterium]|nr:FecR family protein [Pseudomonadota bacterium]